MDDDTLNERLFLALGGQVRENGYIWSLRGVYDGPAGDWRPADDYTTWLDVEREIARRGLEAQYVLVLGDLITDIQDVAGPSSPQEDLYMIWRFLRATLAQRTRAALDVLA